MLNRFYWSDNVERKSYRLTDKRYCRDNKIIKTKRSKRRFWLLYRCRFKATWWWRSYQRFSCSL